MSQLLDAYPDTFAFVQIHHGDSYATSWGNTRSNFYTDFTSYPSLYWDGAMIKQQIEAYSTYLNAYNQRRAATTDVTISLAMSPVQGNSTTVTATVCVETGGTGKAMRINMVQVLDNWPSDPSYSRNTLKYGAPAQTVTVNPGECQVVQHTFTLDNDSLAQPDDIKFIVWAQENQSSASVSNPAEVYQTAIGYANFMTDCNSNGIPDEDDILNGTSEDCNSNIVPDECEFIDNPPIVDQSDFDDQSYVSAQNFSDTTYPTYGVKQWDDFVAPYNLALGAGEAYFRPESWGGYGNIDFLVEVADIPGGAEAGGNVLATTTGTGANGVITWDFGGTPLQAGTYWLSVQAGGGFGSYGMIYWYRANVNEPNGSEHYYHNPGGGWNHGTDPAPISNWPDDPADLAFKQGIIKLADCNSNGILDECDILEGTSVDNNLNGIPDECEGAPPVCAGDSDCDGYVTWRDIDFFVASMNDNITAWEAMFAPGTPTCTFANNDADEDGYVTWRDIDPFVALMNTACP